MRIRDTLVLEDDDGNVVAVCEEMHPHTIHVFTINARAAHGEGILNDTSPGWIHDAVQRQLDRDPPHPRTV
jgi:hypothetical protein